MIQVLLISSILCWWTVSSSSSTLYFSESSNAIRHVEQNQQPQYQRRLDDFDEVNAILRDVRVDLPPVTLTRDRTTVRLSSIACRNLQIDSIDLSSRQSGNNVQLDVTIQNLDMECQARYEYDGFLIGGQGNVDIVSRGNDAVLQGLVRSTSSSISNGGEFTLLNPGFSRDPPNDIDVTRCNPTINVNDMDFSNSGLFGWILDLVEPLFRDAMEDAAQEEICLALRAAMEKAEGLLADIQTTLDDYDPANLILNPLGLENELLQSPSFSTSRLLDLQNTDTNAVRWLTTGLEQAIGFLTTVEADPQTGRSDLKANILLREYLLEDDASLVLDMNDMVLFYGHDTVTESTISIDSAKLVGLDTLTKLQALNTIGHYTLENELGWAYLGFVLDLTIDIKPSTLPDSIIDSNARITEQVQLFVAMDDLQANIAILTALDQSLLENLRIGSLLQTSNIVPCLWSTVVQLEAATFSAQASDVATPSLTGFVSPGLDQLFTEAMDAAFLMYEDLLLEASPAFFQTSARPLLNDNFLRTGAATASCPAPSRGGGSSSSSPNLGVGDLVDLRDLFLTPQEAIAAGAAGNEPYGDLFSSVVMPTLRDEIFQADYFNSRIVRPITTEQSGVQGRLAFPNLVVMDYFDTPSSSSAHSALYQELEFTVSNLRLNNLDIVAQDSISLLEPKDWNKLANAIELSDENGNRHLNVELSILLSIRGEDSPLAMNNQVDFSLSIPTSSLSVELLAALQESALLNYPVNDVTNVYCWLAALGGVSGSGNDAISTSQTRRSTIKQLDLSELSLYISTFSLDANCVSCSSPGGNFISQVLKDLERGGLAFNFKDAIVDLMHEVAWEYWQNLDIEQLLLQAPAYCPHHPTYAPDATPIEVDWPEFPALSKQSGETVLALGMIALHGSLAVSAKNHLLLEEATGGQTGSPETVVIENAQDLVDWTNIAGDLGEWADFAFQEARAYLAEPVKQDDKTRSGITARANELLREYALDGDGGLTIDLGDIEVDMFGSLLTFHHVKVYGLDTISDLVALRPAAPQILENSFKLDELDISLGMTVKDFDTARDEPITVSYKVRDISVQLDAILGLNLDSLGSVPLGSIFDIGNILFCMFHGVQILDLSNLSVTFGAIDNPVVDGYFTIDTSVSLGWMIDSIFSNYRSDILAAVPIMFQTTLRGILSANIPGFIQTMRNSCPSPTPFGSVGRVDLRDLLLSETASSFLGGKGNSPYGNLFRGIYDKLTEEVFRNGATNRPLLNDLLRVVTEKQSNTTGSLYFSGNVMDQIANIKIAGLEAELGLRVSEVAIQNLDSLGDPLDLFRPIDQEPFVLNNTMSFGVDAKPVGLTSRILLSFNDGADVALQNEVELSLSIEDVVLMGSVFLKIAEEALASFPVRDITNYNCWLATLLSKSDGAGEESERGIGLIDQAYSIGNFSLDMSCYSCSSPDFDVLLRSLYLPENVTELEDVINNSIESLSGAELVEVLLDQLVKDSATQCPHRPEYDPEANGPAFLRSPGDALGFATMTEPGQPSIYFTIANATSATLLFIFGVASWYCVRRRNRKWINSLDREGSVFLSRQQRKEREIEAMLNAYTTSMFQSEHIPKKIRWGVPIAILINIGLYAGGHFGVLSTVNVDASVAGEEFTVENFLQFTFIGSTWETYNNGGAEMAILLWIFTGIWPYIKLLLSLLLWMLPPHRLSVERRGRILLWIDALVKLSVIDIFTMVLGVAVLLVFIGGPDDPYLGEGVLYSMKAVVIPGAGFYCLIIAQRMSRVSSRFFLEYHNQIVQRTIKTHESPQLPQPSPQVGNDNESSCSDSIISYPNSSPAIQDTDVSQHKEDQPNDASPPTLLATSFDSEESSTPSSRGSDVFEDDPLKVPRNQEDVDELSTRSVEFRWGTIGVIFGCVTILSVFIIGCIFAPAISLDASSFAGLAVESGLTYEEAVTEYGVFLVASGILVKARFVLNTRADYIGLGLLAIVAVISLAMVFFIQTYLFVKRKLKERRQGRQKGPEYGHEGCGLPLYLRQYKWRHMEIYLISVAIGVWQLGSVSSYAMHLYCDTMRRLYDVLVFAGLVEESTAQCFLIQSRLPGNIIILALSFTTLMLVFIFQMKAQYRKNIEQALRWINDEDVPRLSLAFSRDKSKNSRYSHLLGSQTWDSFSDDGGEQRSAPGTHSTRGLTPPGSPDDDLLGPRPDSPESHMESLEHSSRSMLMAPVTRRSSSVMFWDQHPQYQQEQQLSSLQQQQQDSRNSYRSIMSDPSSSEMHGSSQQQQVWEGESSLDSSTTGRTWAIPEPPPPGLLQSYLEMREEIPSNGAYVVVPNDQVEIVSEKSDDDEYYF